MPLSSRYVFCVGRRPFTVSPRLSCRTDFWMGTGECGNEQKGNGLRVSRPRQPLHLLLPILILRPMIVTRQLQPLRLGEPFPAVQLLRLPFELFRRHCRRCAQDQPLRSHRRSRPRHCLIQSSRSHARRRNLPPRLRERVRLAERHREKLCTILSARLRFGGMDR